MEMEFTGLEIPYEAFKASHPTAKIVTVGEHRFVKETLGTDSEGKVICGRTLAQVTRRFDEASYKTYVFRAFFAGDDRHVELVLSRPGETHVDTNCVLDL